MSDFKLFLRACSLLREFVDDPAVDDTPVGWECHYCGAAFAPTDLRDVTTHDKDCAWAEAVMFLAEYDEGLV